MTDPYVSSSDAAPLNPPSPTPNPGLLPPAERPPLGDFFTEDHDARERRADAPPITAETLGDWAAQLLSLANWMRRNHLP